ncbi:Zinc finger BED domain-containing protein RICESLEEPER 2 [Bienertia sinuspersici]
MMILDCIKIIHSIKETSVANPDPSIKNVLDSMKDKWYAYFKEFPPIYGIAAILDPGIKLQGLTNLLNCYYDQLGINYDVPYHVNKCKIILQGLCEDYGAMIQPQPIGSSTGKSRSGFLGPVLVKQRPYGSCPPSSSNLEDFHISQWWKNHCSKFHVLARIAKDILEIPTSTIASKSTFSAGRRVLDEK